MSKIYISGPMTGYDNFNKDAFDFAKRKLEAINEYDQVITPFDIAPNQDPNSWLFYMKLDIKALMDCDAIYVLKGYENSKGAMIEVNLAKSLSYPIFYEN